MRLLVLGLAAIALMADEAPKAPEQHGAPPPAIKPPDSKNVVNPETPPEPHGAPPPAVNITPPQIVQPDGEEAQRYVTLQLLQQNVNEQLENYRIGLCWSHSVPPKECGQIVKGGVMRIQSEVTSAVPDPPKKTDPAPVQPAAAPEKPKAKAK